MLSDFEIITRHFPENNDIKIYPISDVHLGAAEHLTAEWDNFCKRIYDKLACIWWICGQINDDAIEFCSAGNHLERQQKGNEGDYVMAICYVSHCFGGNSANLERAKQITHDLQVNDPENCYICPLLAFSDLKYNEIGYDAEMALCIDLLSASDVLIVASDISDGVQKEIDFARLVGMEVIDLAEKYRKI